MGNIAEFEEKISIIIPVYNVGSFLPRCIDSLLCQTYSNLEIIIVDDGSTDGSAEICDEYSKKDDRIIVIHQENGGCSSARNAALKIFSGEEMTFVDPDDYVERDYIEKMHVAMHENDADVVICDFDYVDEDGKFLYCSKQRMTEGKHGSRELLYNYISFDKDVFYMAVLWNKLFKRDMVSDLTFPCKYRNYEDSYWCPPIFLSARFGYVINDRLYHYTCNSKSLTHSKNAQKEAAYKTVCVWKKEFMVNMTDYKEAKLAALINEEECRRHADKADKAWKCEIQKQYRELYISGDIGPFVSFKGKVKFFVAYMSIALYYALIELKCMYVCGRKKH